MKSRVRRLLWFAWEKLAGLDKDKGRRVLRLALVLAGVLLIFSPLLMQAYAQYNQHKLLQEAARVPPSVPGEVYKTGEVSGAEDPTVTGGEAGEAIHSGEAWPLVVITIPQIDVEAVVVEDVTLEDLRRGPGHYPQTAWPGEPGNVGIAGHRTTYGAWFRHLDELEPGDAIYLQGEGRTYHYRVEKVWATDPHDWSVVEPTPYPALTLTTCHPPYDDTQRLVVRAALVRDTPAGAAGEAATRE